jgi:hypothetical protein
MIFDVWMKQAREIGQRNAAWALVVALWVFVISLAGDEEWVMVIALLALNFEIIKRGQNANSFAEYLNATIFHFLFYFYVRGVAMHWGLFRTELVFLLEIVSVAVINIRYKFLSLKGLVRFLALAVAISFPFTLWEHAYVPRLGLWRDNIPLEIYYYWMMPIEMLLVAAPFLFTALAEDFRPVRQSAARSAMLDVYYFYTWPLLAFGLFPGVGHSHQANCEVNATYVAIAGTVALVCSGFLLSLVTNRKSIVVASALASLPLGFNHCVTVPFTSLVLVACVITLLAWRWLPKGPARFASQSVP